MSNYIFENTDPTALDLEITLVDDPIGVQMKLNFLNKFENYEVGLGELYSKVQRIINYVDGITTLSL